MSLSLKIDGNVYAHDSVPANADNFNSATLLLSVRNRSANLIIKYNGLPINLSPITTLSGHVNTPYPIISPSTDPQLFYIDQAVVDYVIAGYTLEQYEIDHTFNIAELGSKEISSLYSIDIKPGKKLTEWKKSGAPAAGSGTVASGGVLTVTTVGMFPITLRTAATPTHQAASPVLALLTVIKGTPAPSVTFASGLTYTGAYQSLVTSYSTDPGTTLQFKLDDGDWDVVPPTVRNAGTYTVYYRVPGDDDLWDDFGPVSTTVSVGTVPVSVSSIAADNKTYDGTTAATVVPTFSGIIGSDNLTLVGGTAAFSDSNAGTGKTVTRSGYSLGGADAQNYYLTTTAPLTTTANINSKNVTVQPDAGQSKYTIETADPALTYTVTPALVQGDDFTGELSRAPGTAAGTYPILQGTLALSSNYYLNFVGSVNFTIHTFVPPSIGIVSLPAVKQGSPYNASLGVSGAPTPTVTISGALPAGLTYSADVISGTPTTPGSYPLTVTASSIGGYSTVANFTLVVGVDDWHAVATPSETDDFYRYVGYNDVPTFEFQIENNGLNSIALGDFLSSGDLRWGSGSLFTVSGVAFGGLTIAPFAPPLTLTISVKGEHVPGLYRDTIYLYDTGGNRQPVFTVLFSVYDYSTPIINRRVELIVENGFLTDRKPGMYWIQSATDFLITITPPLAEPDLVPTVSDSRNIKDAVSLTYDNDAGVWLARIRRVQANIQVLVKALDPSGNEAVASSAAPLIWAAIGKLHVVCKDIALSVANPPVIQVYTLTGTLLVAAPAQEGETVIPLSQGIYIVKVGGKVNKVVVK